MDIAEIPNPSHLDALSCCGASRPFTPRSLSHYVCHGSYEKGYFSGSSSRLDLGTGFTPLLLDETDRIDVVLMVALRYFISRPDYKRGYYYCSKCGKEYHKAGKCPNCGTETRKKSRKNGKGDKPRVNFEENRI